MSMMDSITLSLLSDLVEASAPLMATDDLTSPAHTSWSSGFAFAAHTVLGWPTGVRMSDLRFRQVCLEAARAHPYRHEEHETWMRRYVSLALDLFEAGSSGSSVSAHVTTLHHDGFKYYFTCAAGDVNYTDNAYDESAEAEAAALAHTREHTPRR